MSELHPLSACTIECADGSAYLFEPQRKCRGNRTFRDTQIMGELLDKWLACGVYDREARRCKFAREIPKAHVVFMSCRAAISDLCALPDARCATMPGEDQSGHSLTPQ